MCRNLGKREQNVNQIIRNALRKGRNTLLEPEAKRICKKHGIPIPQFRVAHNSAEAVQAAKKLGFPVAIKIVSPDILHKTDAGCVLLALGSPRSIRDGYAKLLRNARRHNLNAKIVGVLVEKMQRPGIEVIIGGLRDAQFGPTLMFGLGGIFVELFEDTSFRVGPLTERSARAMIREIRGYQILMGYRGRSPADEDSLVRILLSTSKLLTEHPEISQLDLNPTLVYKKGAVVVDARMKITGVLLER